MAKKKKDTAAVFPPQVVGQQSFEEQGITKEPVVEEPVVEEPVMEDQSVEEEAVDIRPESSPYASPMILFYFGDGLPLRVPSALLYKAPKLSACCEPDQKVHLRDVPSDSGHVLVHYLFTDQYQSLKPGGTSSYDRSLAEFATSVRVYGIAQAYDLRPLKTLTQSEMQRLGQELEVMKAIEVVKDLHPTLPADDKWLHNYLKSLLGKLMDRPPTSPPSISPIALGQNLPVFNVLMGIMVDLYHERMDLSRGGTEDPIAFDSHGQGAQAQQATAMARPESEPAHSPKLTPMDPPEEFEFPEQIPSLEKGKNKEEEGNSTDWWRESEVADETKALIEPDSAPESVTSLNEKIWECVEGVHQINIPQQDPNQEASAESHANIARHRPEPDLDLELRSLPIPSPPSSKPRIGTRLSFDKNDEESRFIRATEPLLDPPPDSGLWSVSSKAPPEEDQSSPSSSKALPETSSAGSRTPLSATPTFGSSGRKPTPSKTAFSDTKSTQSRAPGSSGRFSLWLKDVNHIPSTLASYKSSAMLSSVAGGGVEVFHHICVQEKFRKFSPEELRWKHALVKKILG